MQNTIIRFNLSMIGRPRTPDYSFLNVGLPTLVQYLPTLCSFHFSLCCMFVKILHCPKTMEEIKLADKLIHYYCQTAPQVYDPKIELYSLHAHLHLPTQVLSK